MNYIPALFFLIAGLSVLGSHYGFNLLPYFEGLSLLTGWIFVLLGVYFLLSKAINGGIANHFRKKYPHPSDEKVQ